MREDFFFFFGFEASCSDALDEAADKSDRVDDGGEDFFLTGGGSVDKDGRCNCCCEKDKEVLDDALCCAMLLESKEDRCCCACSDGGRDFGLRGMAADMFMSVRWPEADGDDDADAPKVGKDCLRAAASSAPVQRAEPEEPSP